MSLGIVTKKPGRLEFDLRLGIWPFYVHLNDRFETKVRVPIDLQTPSAGICGSVRNSLTSGLPPVPSVTIVLSSAA